jgi:hypothetical protein
MQDSAVALVSWPFRAALEQPGQPGRYLPDRGGRIGV